jgi:Fic family protein
MMSLRQFAERPEVVPASTAWYLADLGEARGKQELFTRQTPQRLRILREHALIESAVSSNRIEGVEVEPGRIGTIVFGRPLLRDRNEEEVRGYRDALKLIHSLERLIEQNKERYYETLEQSSTGWHDGRHDPWPFVTYLLFILKTAYREFEERVGKIASPKGAKAEIVREAIRRQTGEFRLAEIERLCPGVGREWIRALLADMKASGEASCHGKGPAARWRYLGSKGTTPK